MTRSEKLYNDTAKIMVSKTATVIGATGMIGQNLVGLLLKDKYFDTTRIIVRRPVEKMDPGMEVKLVDFSNTESLKLALEGSDTIFCCIGTTQKKVKGDKALYRSVDFDIPVNAARLGKETGCEKFIVVSAVGANPDSNNFYLRLKGEMEEALKQTGVKSIHIMRPSMLLGKRSESRPAEKVGQVLSKALSFLLPSKYKPVEGMDVAKAMLKIAKEDRPGVHVYHFKEIEQLTDKL
jgi:uncharacterized protein YbjT (DUF2867 family)